MISVLYYDNDINVVTLLFTFAIKEQPFLLREYFLSRKLND